jgi:hypothetical protein
MARTRREIDYFIELANDCPSGYKPLGFEQQEAFDPRKLKEHLAEELRASDELKRNPKYAKCDAGDLKRQLRLLWGVQNTLSGIVRAARKTHEHWPVPVDLGITIGQWVVVRRDGNMKVFASYDHQEFNDALERSDARRIRECYCGKFFYALRTTKRFCSDNCRVNRWADSNFEAWNKIQERHQRKRAVKRRREKAGRERSPKQIVPKRGSAWYIRAVRNANKEILVESSRAGGE